MFHILPTVKIIFFGNEISSNSYSCPMKTCYLFFYATPFYHFYYVIKVIPSKCALMSSTIFMCICKLAAVQILVYSLFQNKLSIYRKFRLIALIAQQYIPINRKFHLSAAR